MRIYVIAYSCINPCEYITAILKSADLCNNDLIKACAKMLQRKALTYSNDVDSDQQHQR